MYYDDNDVTWVGTSSEPKPLGQANGIKYYETDTGNIFLYVNGWILESKGAKVGSLIMSPSTYLWADGDKNLRIKDSVPQDRTDGQTVTSQRVMVTPEGGIAVKLTNNTGAVSVKGALVTTSSAVAMGVVLVAVDIPNPIGVFYESGVANGAEAWVVVSGITEVLFVGNTTRGHLARGFITGDSGYVAGRALSEAVPTSPFASDKHFYEIGHLLESRVGAGLAKIVMHFN